MSIRNIVPHLLLALITLPSCGGETNDRDATHDSGADTTEDTKPNEGRDGGSKDDGDDTKQADASNTSNDADDTNEHAQDGGTVAPDASDVPDETSDPDQTNVNEPEDDGGVDPDEPDESSDAQRTSFFLPTTEPDNTVAPRVEIDAQGGIHTVYPAYAGGGAYYSYCAQDCNSTDAFEVVQFPSDETVVNAMVALTSDGKPRVLLSMFTKAVFAACDNDCTDQDNWSSGEILNYRDEGQIDREISGEALALDPDGNPHFISHTYRAYLGIGQEKQLSHHHACVAADCTDVSNWTEGVIATQTWEESQLEFDAEGTAHLAFVAIVESENQPTTRIAAYAACEDDCNKEESWSSSGLITAYTDQYEAFNLTSSLAMALTSQGKPRLIVLGKSAEGEKNLAYFECDDNCTGEGSGWVGSIISTSPDVNVGLDLALDAQDRPRFVHTLDYSIAFAWCDSLPCSDADAGWDLEWVEVSGDIPTDDIILFPNCTVAAWFLHSPFLALDGSGNPYVGYQARDVSGGVSNPDPFDQDCVAGTDMTLTRMTQMVLE
jgi:hypothetical protein